VSHRDGDEGGTTPPGDDELSAEDEFREWAEAANADPPEPSGQSWAGRIFGRRNRDEEAPPIPEPEPEPESERDIGPSPEDLENPHPEQLGVFRAVRPGDAPPPGLRSVPDPDEPAVDEAGNNEPEADTDALAAAQGGRDGAADTGSASPDQADIPRDGEDSTPPAPERDDEQTARDDAADADTAPEDATDDSPDAGTPGFDDLWSDADGSEDDVVDFAKFTSEDYLAATTREYAGLAEAVARAEEEETQRIAVSAEIRGLESGLVGLDDVVDAEGGAGSADVIEPPAGSDLPIRVLTGLGLLVLFVASLLSPYGIGALIFVVLGIAAGEMFASFIRGGYRPLSIFGFLGIAGAFVGTWVSGPVAVPIALLTTAVAVLLFYATAPGRRSAVENASLTILVTAWIGGMGAFAFDLLDSEDYVWLVLALVVTVAAMDIGQYFIGRRLGRRSLAPVISPKKTVEGYVAGIIVAVTCGAAFAWAPPFELTDGVLIGVTVAVVAPIGDLAVSVVKRALGIKDMGYILPGHGGVMDRVDAMIVTIPALWIAYSWMGLLS
jgi:phosphatidate cytidylyltransferase